MKINFVKATASGNDFVIIDNRKTIIDEKNSNLIKLLCDRRFGVGADGVILIENSKTNEFEMKYFNSDGKLGSLCGNGSRCTARFIYEFIEKKDLIKFEALGKNYSATISGEDVKLFLPDLLLERKKYNIDLLGKKSIVHFVDTGSPHAVVFTEEIKDRPYIDSLDVYKIGKMIRHSDTFSPEGTNVNFVEIAEKNVIKIRTFERGVEDETLACGTGSVASAIIAHFEKSIECPVTLLTRGGLYFTVGFEAEGIYARNIFLQGLAQIVFKGFCIYDSSKNFITGLE